eukprot:jgi/Picsp_1/879/NSC_04367-R1_homeodomain protein
MPDANRQGGKEPMEVDASEEHNTNEMKQGMDAAMEEKPGTRNRYNGNNEKNQKPKLQMKKTPEQKRILEEAFQQKEFLDNEMRKRLAEKTGLTEHQINIWFSHRRRKERENDVIDSFRQAGESEGFDEIDETTMDRADQLKYEEMKELVERAKETLDVAYRTDGPPMALYFDEMPMLKARKRKVSASELNRDDVDRAVSLATKARQEMMRLETSIRKEKERIMREKERTDTKLARERERELVRLENERRRQLERALKEQRREEERREKEEARLRSLQLREEKRLEAMRQKELKKEERRKEREEKRKEKELLKALSKREKETLKMRNTYGSGVKDDLEIEWDEIVKKYKAEHDIPEEIEVAEGGEAPAGTPPFPSRPEFPPSKVEMHTLGPVGTESKFAGDLISAWAFLNAFNGALALDTMTLDGLLEALAMGSDSSQTAKIHMSLIRLLQADAEESKANGYGQSSNKSEEKDESVVFTGSRLLEEAWAWGFDVDSWRAHLNEITWPEVCRQICVSAGLGRRRPKQRISGKARTGKTGEDIVVSSTTGKLELKLPSRLSVHSVKGAAWMVLKDAGYEGLRVEEIARRIQKMGHRDLRTSKTPEASVAGAMGRDVLFERIAPATYALQSLRVRYKELNVEREEEEDETMAEDETQTPAANSIDHGKDQKDSPTEENGTRNEDDNDNEVNIEEEESEEEDAEAEEERRKRDEAHTGEEWVEQLKLEPYNALSLEFRAALLSALCQLILDSPTVRETIERRLEEQNRIRRSKADEDKAEANLLKQRKQLEQVVKLRDQAYESEKQLEKFNSVQEGREYDESKISKSQKSLVEIELEEKVAAAEKALAAMAGGALNSSKEDIQKRAQIRAEQALKDLEKNSVRVEPLGMDRRYNKYWRFASDIPDDVNQGRIFVEDTETGCMKLICSQDSFNALLESLNTDGPREQELQMALVQYKEAAISFMPSRPFIIPDQIQTPRIDTQNIQIASCGKKLIKGKEIQPVGGPADIALVKEAMICICEALKVDCFTEPFSKSKFCDSVKKTNTLSDLRGILGSFEQSISSSLYHEGFSLDPLLVRGAWISIGAEVATALPGSTAADVLLPLSPEGIRPETQKVKDDEDTDEEHEPKKNPLAWLPATIQSLALRVATLDASLMYENDICGRDDLMEYKYSLRPCRTFDAVNGLVKSMHVKENGRMCPTLCPPFPYRLLISPRMEFVFPVVQFENDVSKGSDAMISVSFPGRPKQSIASGRGRRRGGTRRKSVGRGGMNMQAGRGTPSLSSRRPSNSDPNYGTDGEEDFYYETMPVETYGDTRGANQHASNQEDKESEPSSSSSSSSSSEDEE